MRLSNLQHIFDQELQDEIRGKLIAVKGPIITAKIPFAKISDICHITKDNKEILAAQVVSFDGDVISLTPYGNTEGIHPGATITNSGKSPFCLVGPGLIGQTCDAFGNLIEGKIKGYTEQRPLFAPPPNPLTRRPIDVQFESGIAAIDGLCPIGVGQRIGLFAGPGVGKSTLLGMISRFSNADVNVIALVGERGREVLDFINNNLGSSGLEKSILVVATSEQSSAVRMLASYTAQTIAEYFRDQGKNVLLMIDSITRMARATREVNLSAGELPVRQGYTPSVYTELPRLLERAGNSDQGTITAIYTVLTQNHHEHDALAEEIISLLDGHIVLSQELAQSGIRPAIDILKSVSRLQNELVTSDYLRCVNQIKRLIFRLEQDKASLMFGGTADPELELAIKFENQINALRSQITDHKTNLSDIQNSVREISDLLSERSFNSTKC